MSRLPPEWEPQAWLWIGFPHLAEEWDGELERAQEQIAACANAIAETGQEVRLIVRDEESKARAQGLTASQVALEMRAYGDIWLRDTGPLIVERGGVHRAVRFGFNGWGGKFVMPDDADIGAELARDCDLPLDQHAMVLEGGAVDVDGRGVCLTTEQCLLNPNRNPHLSRAEIEAELACHLGARRVIWLGEGLAGDHTDGHVDNLARFIAPGEVVVPEARDGDDPNAAAYEAAARRIERAGLTLRRIPSAGRIERKGQLIPASHANFLIANRIVIVPTFGVPSDAEATAKLAALFPERACIGLPCDAVLAGGGGFHCASMQMPASTRADANANPQCKS